MESQKPKRRTRDIILIALMFLFLAVFLFSGIMLVTTLVRSGQEEKALSELAARVPERPSARPAGTPVDGTDTRPGSTGALPQDDPTLSTAPEEPEVSIYAPLAAENPDLFGWITIEGTGIDYPVMFTPEDPEYYLHRAFDKSYAYSGVPFLDAGCFDGCGNYLVYGHHMNNGTMFAKLLSYRNEDFWREHPIIQFDTLEEYGDYQVMAAFYSKAYLDTDENVFRYYRYTDLTQEETFNDYVNQVLRAALYDTGVRAQYGDQLLTLSTCSYHTLDGRFVVVAKKISG